MITRIRKIAVAGTHSTGKTTFLNTLRAELKTLGYCVGYVHDNAAQARDRGFPILKDHNFESTAWLMSQAISMETEASLAYDVILVDRPVMDALGYLLAALRYTDRELPPRQLESLRAISAAWVGEYDLIFVTKLDPDIPLGEGRDLDAAFRLAAAQAISEILAEMAPHAIPIKHGEEAAAREIALACVAEAHLCS